MLAGPDRKDCRAARDEVYKALAGPERSGRFVLRNWLIEGPLDSTQTMHKWERKAAGVNAIIFLFGADAGRLKKEGQVVYGEVMSQNTTATEREFDRSYLRPTTRFLILHQKTPIHDEILLRIIDRAREHRGTLAQAYANPEEAARQARDFASRVVEDLGSHVELAQQEISRRPMKGLIPDPQVLGLEYSQSTLAEAPVHILAAVHCLEEAHRVRRQPHGFSVNEARPQIARAIYFGLTQPGGDLEELDQYLGRLRTYHDNGELLPMAESLSSWEKLVFLLSISEAGLINRYKDDLQREIETQLIGAPILQSLAQPAASDPEVCRRCLYWGVIRWKEVFIAACAYSGHPQYVPTYLGPTWVSDFANDMKTMQQWQEVKPDKTVPGRSELALGVWYAATDVWEKARKHFQEAIRLSKDLPGSEYVHSLVLLLWVTEDRDKREEIRGLISTVEAEQEESRHMLPFYRSRFERYPDALWHEVFPSPEA